MAREFELKLRLGPKQFTRMAELLGARAMAAPTKRRLKSVYFDTPDHGLATRRVALRVRHDGERRVQTIKAEKGDRQGYARGEWERELAGDQPELSDLPDAGEASRLLAGAAVRERLEPVFVTDFERSEWLLDLGEGTEVVCTLDQGEVRSGSKHSAIREAELELKAGHAAQVFDLARRLHRDATFRMESRSKAALGYALRAFTPAPPRFAPPDLDPAETAEAATKRIAGACIAHLRTHQGRLMDHEDPLAIHQMRVASRRLRSLLQLLRNRTPSALADVSAELSWFAKRLAPARDWDVFLAETLAPVRESLPGDPSLEVLAEQAGQARQRAYRRARRALETRRFTAMLLDVGYWFELEDWSAPDDKERTASMKTPVADVARPLLNRLWLAARDGGHDLTLLDRRALHALRIRIKKLRYGSEFFASLFVSGDAKPLLGLLRRLQDLLGHIQDVTATAALLADIAPRKKKHVRAIQRAAGIIAGWQASAERATRTQLARTWADFEAQEPFWT
ncbi:MAG: CYTH and CHAD domain-containing protein [Planctomycetota bacterium]|jgi:inorganic triphosphatase YgiF